MSEQIVNEIQIIKRDRIISYPYYPITATYLNNQISYILSVESTQSDPYVRILPFMESKGKAQYEKLPLIDIELRCFPRRVINSFIVISIEDEIKNGRVEVRNMEFLVGFCAGFLLHCSYINKIGSPRDLQILSKLNKCHVTKESIWSRMNSALFSEEEFYKPSIGKPIRSLNIHKAPSKYKISYMVGNRLFLSASISELVESATIKQFAETEWGEMEINTIAKLKTNSVILNCKKFKALITSNSMLIEWTHEICNEYIYTIHNELIIADRDENKIIVYDLIANLKEISIINHDLDLKKIQFYEGTFGGQNAKFLIIMPYDANFYVLNMNSNEIICIQGHRSYIANACITRKGSIITGGLDHGIGIKFLEKIEEWTKLKSSQNEKIFEIESKNIKKENFDEIFFEGIFKNVNEERNNNLQFGFGNLLPLGYESELYTFVTYDSNVKIYCIQV